MTDLQDKSTEKVLMRDCRVLIQYAKFAYKFNKQQCYMSGI